MKQRIRKALAIAIATFASALPAGAERVLSVDEAAALALADNASLRQAAIALETKRRDWDPAWNKTLPTISASGGLSSAPFAASLLAVSAGAFASLTLSRTSSDSLAIARLEYESQALSYEASRRSLELSARKGAFGILLDEENLRLARQNIAREEKSYAQTEAKYKAGYASELDLLSAKVSLETLRPKADAYATTLANDLDTLKGLLGLGADDELSIEGGLETDDGRVAELLSQAMSRPESEGAGIASAKMALEIAESDRDSLIAAKTSPSLSISASATPSATLTTGLELGVALSLSASATLSYPIGNLLEGSAANKGIANAKDSVAEKEVALEKARKDALAARKSCGRSVEGARGSLSALRLNVDLTQRSYDAVKKAYENGLVEISSLQSASASLESAKLCALAKSYELIAAILELEYQTGSPFDTIGRK